MSELTTIILAAGAGTRMKSDRAKVAHEVAGRSMLGWVIKAAQETEADKLVVVTGHREAEVRTLVPEGTICVSQEQRLGTGHAVSVAAKSAEIAEGTVLILYGDTPLIRSETLKKAFHVHKAAKNSLTILTADMQDPSGYGRIIKDECGQIIKVVEQRDADGKELKINKINTGVYIVDSKVLKTALPKLDNKNSQGEYYLTDIVAIIAADGACVGEYEVSDPEEMFGVNDRHQLSIAESILLGRIRTRHMKAGVTIRLPETTWISDDAVIGENTEILPGTVLEKRTVVGTDCVIGPYTRIAASKLANCVKVEQSVIIESEIGEYSTIGPFAYIRPESTIGSHVKIGDFVEIKKSIIGDNTKISHLTYVGDAEIGKRVNLGCGVVVVNYDGKTKSRTIIRDDAFVGCNTNLVSPVEIEENAYIAAGSTITYNVPAYSLGIARSRQVVKNDWVRTKGYAKTKNP